ncbi:MAG: DUF84 family protein [Alphaproteobacteria bacterium]|nr:DUF84 family protein [Alphaproteobacteria bacterium]
MDSFAPAPLKSRFASIAELRDDIHTAAVASTNRQKTQGITRIFPDAHILSGKFNTNVSEYPYGADAVRGCVVRLKACEEAFPQADAWISTETGAFDRNDTERNFLDRPLAIIKFKRDERIVWALGAGAIFPRVCLEDAHPGYPQHFIPANDHNIGIAIRKLAFETGIYIAGEGMVVPQGTLVDPRDPHLALTGKSRATIIEETYACAMQALENESSYVALGDQDLANVIIKQLGLQP